MRSPVDRDTNSSLTNRPGTECGTPGGSGSTSRTTASRPGRTPAATPAATPLSTPPAIIDPPSSTLRRVGSAMAPHRRGARTGPRASHRTRCPGSTLTLELEVRVMTSTHAWRRRHVTARLHSGLARIRNRARGLLHAGTAGPAAASTMIGWDQRI